jgi:riboflavin biosynthesis pyrimidine reductase
MFCGSLLDAGWADEIHYFIGAKILADTNALPVFKSDKLIKLEASVGLTLKSASTFDNDIYLHYAIDSL